LIPDPDTVYDPSPMKLFLAIALTVSRVPARVMVFPETVARYVLPN
jgi:hypothetical protein